MSKDVITNGNMIIAESKKFIDYPNSLNDKQLQLILLLVAQIKQDDKKYEWINIPCKTLIRLYNNSNDRSKDSEKSVVDNVFDLVKKTYYIEDNSDIYAGHYIDKIKYNKKNKIMSVKLSDETRYFFLEFNDGVYMHYGQIKKLHTKSAIQLYMWAVSKSGFKNSIPIKIDDIKELLYGNKEIKTKDFIRWHLEPAIKKINELTDISIQCEKIPDKNNKRKISSLKFTITKNSSILDENENFISIYSDDKEENEFDPFDDPNYAEWYEKKNKETTEFMTI